MRTFLSRALAASFICGLFFISGCRGDKVNPTEDSVQFVTLTDVVPDVILEIRYYGTYNFVGTRIDGYEKPTALTV